jgi:hypothetical protein
MTTAVIDRPPLAPAAVKRVTASHFEDIVINEIVPSPKAQRDFRKPWGDHLAANFDLEGMGIVVVNKRDGHYYCVDGQHRIYALKELGFGADKIRCEVFVGLSDKEEADLFLRRNDQLTVAALDKFKVAVEADRELETTIRRLVMAQGLAISRTGGITSVHALTRAYKRQGPAGFSRTLRVIRDAYGETGFAARVIDGISLFLHRYDGQVDEAVAIAQLGAAHGGVNGLLGLAQKERAASRGTFIECVAATATVLYNRARGKKLAPWWKQ